MDSDPTPLPIDRDSRDMMTLMLGLFEQGEASIPVIEHLSREDAQMLAIATVAFVVTTMELIEEATHGEITLERLIADWRRHIAATPEL